MSDFTTAAGIAGTAVALANVVVWAWGAGWRPQVKAATGALCALCVFVLGVVLWPEAWPDGPTAFSTLFQALLVVLAAAGAPVFRDVIRGEEGGWQSSTTASGMNGLAARRRRGRRWEGWNR